MTNPKFRYDKSDIPKTRKRQTLSTENPVGLRLIELLGSRDFGWLAAKTGIPASTLSDYVQKGISKADNAIKIADALDVSIDRLLTGRPIDRIIAAPAVLASDAEWESVPFFDLQELTDTGKGEPQSWTPFRKDWLNRTLGTSFDLYLVRLRSDFRSRAGDRDLSEGDLVFCREITPVELAEGYICIFRRDQGLMVARYSLRPAERVDEDVITSAEIGDDLFVPVARILGRFAQRL